MNAPRKALRLGLYLMATTLAVMLALAAALWAWSGSGSSLNTALEQLAAWLPADQTLEASDVTGSLRSGGHIGWLRWRRANLSADISVELHDVNLSWSLRTLIGGELRLGLVAAQHLRIEDHSPPNTEERQPPLDLRLPVRVDIPFTVETAEWVGATSVKASGLAGHYVFDSYSHRLYEGQARISSGTYRLEGSVQALSPMALTVQADGAVQTTVPSSPKPLQLRAHAEIQGTLAGRDATLSLQADLAPEPLPTRQGALQPKQAMQAHVSARIQPWQDQPVVQAKAHWQALNLAVLWPQAPQTQLNGQATIKPQGTGWQAGIQLSNTLSGPWDQQHLPVEQLEAQVAYSQGQWNLQSLHATGAGGQVQAQGRVGTTTPPQWHGSATVHGIQPAALDSRLGGAALNGQLSAQQGPGGMAFDAQLQTAQGANTARVVRKARPTTERTLEALRIQALRAQGVWNSPVLKLSTLNVQTDDAQLQGQLTWHTLSQAAEGQLTLRLPGAQAKLEGNLTRTTGQGAWDLHMTDAALASRWLHRLPGVQNLLGPRLLQGNAAFTGRWAGGWQNQGKALQLQAQLRIPRLDLLTSGQAWHVHDGLADLAGTLREFTLSAQGQMETGTQQFKLQAQATGGRLNESAWQAQLHTAQLSMHSTRKPGTWALQLNDNVSLHWTQGASTRTLETSAGSLRLSGPMPGGAVLRWQNSQWSQHSTNAPVRTQWRTQGDITDLPLAWMDLLGNSRMAALGLRGDMVLAGQWDASSDQALKLRATLQRTGGDLLLQTNPVGADTLHAGVRDARIVLTTDGNRLSASLRWDSERAGQAQAQFSTRIQQRDGSWSWPSDAALAGSVQAQLPPLGIWSVLAPPGWRLHGTLESNVVLSGTRRAPQWSGTLAAHELAVRSVVDGIDLRHGTLRALLAGQRLDLQEFSIQGAEGGSGGDGGGLLSVKGSVQWLQNPSADASGLAGLKQGLRMDLEATAKALRLSTRADRRLVVSGQLFAQLREAQLTIRGLLKADQALWVLPEETAPQLGSDVVVRKPNAALGQSQTGIASQPVSTGISTRPDIAITLDLGPDFQVRGRGVNTRLAGKLDLQSAGLGTEPRLTGTLHTEQGRYEAYGQNLDIEQGLLRFAGPYNNPALDILAIRPNLQQRVGVQISGTAQAPAVRLYAQPDLPDAEKLAWLVLGRSGAEGGAETAMLQQAALSLLGGKGKGISGGLAQALRLDELSIRTDHGDAAQAGDGSTNATILLGKRLSRDFYLAYERGLTGTLGTLSIFYDLSSRFAVRAQTGEQSAVDLIFTLPYD